MKRSCLLSISAAPLAMFPLPALAAPVPCGSGTLDIAVSSDTPVTGAAFNVGQKATFTRVASGVSPTAFSWTIPGPHIKDYNDDLGTRSSGTPAAPTPWSTTPLSPADLSSPSVSLYFKPSAAQIHPLNGPPETRAVTLTATIPGGTCTVSTNVTVERNLTDPNRQPEDYYTSNRRASTTTNGQLGNVVDEHMYWHQFVGGGATGSWLQFLPWHSYFLGRFDQWRAEFGYPEVAPWYPGRPLPTGPQFDHTPALRLTYLPDSNRLPTRFTLAGTQTNLANGMRQYATLEDINAAFEPFFHGTVHCNIGASVGGFFDTSGPGFGSMCNSSSPKDPMFWRWHGFIDRMYRNYCRVKAISCHIAAMPAADVWMADNAADLANGGTTPSPGPHWMSPDVWNRRSEVTTDACLPRNPPPNLLTVGGTVRDCGSDADHENPVSGSQNFLYATVRNTSGEPQRNVYAEVAVYIANASTGLAWPTDFTMLPESRQLITLNLEPGQSTDIGPLPWIPPSPSPSDHFCIYVKVLSVQETAPTEGSDVGQNVANSNSIAWRNMKVVPPGSTMMMSKFIVRQIRDGAETVDLVVQLDPRLRDARVILAFDERLQQMAGDTVRTDGAHPMGRGRFLISSPRAYLGHIRLPHRASGAVELQVAAPNAREGDVIITQMSNGKVDGGVTLRVGSPR